MLLFVGKQTLSQNRNAPFWHAVHHRTRHTLLPAPRSTAKGSRTQMALEVGSPLPAIDGYVFIGS